MDDLTDLVGRLRRAGFKVDTRQYLTAHALVLAFAREGRILTDTEDFLRFLGPIFCRSPEEQQLFAEITRKNSDVVVHPDPGRPLSFNKVFAHIVTPLMGAVLTAVLVYALTLAIAPIRFDLHVVREVGEETVSPGSEFRPAPNADVRLESTPIKLDKEGKGSFFLHKWAKAEKLSIRLTGYSHYSEYMSAQR
jgi:hypothetical protein